MKRRQLILAGVGLALAACASSGKRFNPSLVDRLEKGRSTASDAVALLGPPQNRTVRQSDGWILLQWIYVGVSPLGSDTRHMALLFDENGVYQGVVQETRY